jgi:hypothetical protein
VVLWMELRVNKGQVGLLQVQRLLNDNPQSEDICLYMWDIELHDRVAMSAEPLPHRYGDGAWELVRKVIETAGPVEGWGKREDDRAH